MGLKILDTPRSISNLPTTATNNVNSRYLNSVWFVLGSSGYILRSTDGETWYSYNTGFSTSANDMAYGANVFVAVGNTGKIASSADGVTWTLRTSGTTNNLVSVDFDGTTFVAVGQSGTMLTSTDGAVWTSRTSGFSTTDIRGIIYAGAKWVAFSATSINVSTSATTWPTSTTNIGTSSASNIAYNTATSTYIIIDTTTIFKSKDGAATWTTVSAKDSSGNGLNLGSGGVGSIGLICDSTGTWYTLGYATSAPLAFRYRYNLYASISDGENWIKVFDFTVSSSAGCCSISKSTSLLISPDSATTAIGSSKVVSVFPDMFPTPNSNNRGAALFSNGTSAYWAYPGEPNTVVGSGFRYRSIFTHGYVAGGYKGSNPWRSINKTWHANDVTYYCGEQLDRAGAYLDGTFSDYFAWVHGTVNAFSGSSVHTSSYNLYNGVGRTWGDGSFGPQGGYGYTGNNPSADGFTYGSSTAEGTTATGVGGWNMSVARDNHGAATNQIGQAGYVVGGGSAATDKLHFATEVMYTTTSAPASYGGHSSGTGMENRAYLSLAGTKYYITYSTDTYTSWSGTDSTDGMNKKMPTKHGHFYSGYSSNVSDRHVKVSDSTGSDISTVMKPRSYGEENMEMGQDWGYMLGQYDGQQNNHTVKYVYTTDTLTTLGATAQPKGHYGQSSAACSSAAATITSGQT